MPESFSSGDYWPWGWCLSWLPTFSNVSWTQDQVYDLWGYPQICSPSWWLFIFLITSISLNVFWNMHPSPLPPPSLGCVTTRAKTWSPFYSSSTLTHCPQRPETSFYSINQITHGLLTTHRCGFPIQFQQNTNSFCVPQSPPCSEPACLFKSHHSSPWPRATARSTLSPLLAHSFIPLGAFTGCHSLSGTQFLQIYMGASFPLLRALLKCHFLREATQESLANRRKDPSCPTIFT